MKALLVYLITVLSLSMASADEAPTFLERRIDNIEGLDGEDFQVTTKPSIRGGLDVFSNALVINPNNELGLQMVEEVTLRDRVLIHDGDGLLSFIGIDSKRRLVNVIRYSGTPEERNNGESIREYVRILSGERKIKDFFVQSNGEVFATDMTGKLYSFVKDDWFRNGVLKLRNKRTSIALYVTLLTVAVASGVESMLIPEIGPLQMLFLNSVIAVPTSLGMNAWLTSIRFEEKNTKADGLMWLKTSVPRDSYVVPVRDDEQNIVDYSFVVPVSYESSKRRHLGLNDVSEVTRLSEKASLGLSTNFSKGMFGAAACQKIVKNKIPPSVANRAVE